VSWIPAVLALVAVVLIVMKLRSALGKSGDPSLQLWEDFAKEHDLSFSAGDLVKPAQVAGAWKGRAVQIERGPAPIGLLHIKVVTHTHLAPELILRREEGAAAMGKLAGMQDIQTGNQALDDLLRIQGLGEKHIVSLLSDKTVARRLGQLFSRYSGALVDKNCVSLVRKRTTRPPEDLVALLDALVNAAEALDRANRELSGSGLGEHEAFVDFEDERPTDPGVEEEDTAPLPDMSSPLLEVFDTLSDRSLNDEARASVMRAVGSLSFALEVDGISRTSGRVPDHLQRGRTVEGHPPGHASKRLIIRFPPSRNGEIEAFGFGHRVTVEARPVEWDAFMARLTMDSG